MRSDLSDEVGGGGATMMALVASLRSWPRVLDSAALMNFARGLGHRTKAAAKKRFKINGSGLLVFRRAGKHHKNVKKTVNRGFRLSGAGVMSVSTSRRLRNSYFPGIF